MELNPLERDALREIGEMSAGSAAAAMSKLASRRVTHVTSQLHEVPARDVAGTLGVAGSRVAGAVIRLEGDLRGALLLAFPETSAAAVADSLQGKPAGTTRSLGAMEQSALKELANVVAGSYLRTFYNFLGFDVSYHVPAVALGGWEPLVKYSFLGTTPGAERVWVVASTLDFGSSESGRLFVLLDAKGMERVLGAVHRRMHA